MIVPLLGDAAAIVESQPKTELRIFPRSGDAVSANWTRTCQRLGIEDLTFHDPRHAAITDLFKRGYSWSAPLRSLDHSESPWVA